MRVEERCTFSLTIEPDAKSGDPSVLEVVEQHPLARGVQGSAWAIFRALHAGATRVVAFGGCTIRSPMPAEPSAIRLMCERRRPRRGRIRRGAVNGASRRQRLAARQ